MAPAAGAQRDNAVMGWGVVLVVHIGGSGFGVDMNKVILWALPQGQTDRLHERPLTSFPLTAAEADKVQVAASKDGWHGFRRQVDDNSLPDFARAITL